MGPPVEGNEVTEYVGEYVGVGEACTSMTPSPPVLLTPALGCKLRSLIQSDSSLIYLTLTHSSSEFRNLGGIPPT